MRNAYLLVLGNAFGQTWPIRAVIFLYYMSVGSTPGQYQLAQWLMFWVLLFVEVPTGWLSDRWSRKGVLVTGATLKLIGIGFYAGGDTVWWLIAGEQVLALAKGFHSGTVEAMLKESLGATDQTSYRRMTAMLDITANGFQLVAVAAGGIIAMYDIRMTAYLSVAMSVISLILFLLTKDTVRIVDEKQQAKLRRGIRGAFADMGHGFKTVWSNPTLRCVSLCHALVQAGSQLMYQLRQPYAVDVGLPKQYFGWMEAAALAAMIGGGWLARRAHPGSDRVWIVVMGAGLFGGMIAAGLLPMFGLPVLVLIGVLCLTRGVMTFSRPICDDILQSQHIEDQRATVLSIAKFQGYALVAIGGPGVHWLVASGYSAVSTLMIVGAVGLGIFIFLLATHEDALRPPPKS